jgi:hypothetical protein
MSQVASIVMLAGIGVWLLGGVAFWLGVAIAMAQQGITGAFRRRKVARILRILALICLSTGVVLLLMGASGLSKSGPRCS